MFDRILFTALKIFQWEVIGWLLTIAFLIALFWWHNKFKKSKILQKIENIVKPRKMTQKDIEEYISELFKKERKKFWNIIKLIVSISGAAILFQAGMLIASVSVNRTSIKYQSESIDNLTETVNNYIKSNDEVIIVLSKGVVKNKANIDAIEKYGLSDSN